MSEKLNEVPKAWFDKPHDPAAVDSSLGHDLIQSLTKIYRISRKSDWPVLARHAKASEELGELGTAVLVEQGFMKHKVLKESSVGEVADTIICVLDVLFASYPHLCKSDVLRQLSNELHNKSDKWNGIVDDLNKGKN